MATTTVNLDNINHIITIEAEIQKVLGKLARVREREDKLNNGVEVEEIEQEIVKLTDQLASLMIAQKVQQSLDRDEIKEEGLKLAKSYPKKMKSQGPREVKVRFSRGEAVAIKTGYYSQAGKKRGKKKRAGLYPGLILLGIHERCSPALVSEVSKLSVALSSFEEVEQVLADRGFEIDDKTIQAITMSFAQRVRMAQKADEEGSFAETVEGRRVVISTDGGRVRIRKYKPGRKTKKGRRRFKAEWREPKLLIIYTVDETGKRERTFMPIIDGTLKGPNAVFGLIKYYLAKLDLDQADKILFVADGARWIWHRVQSLMSSLGIQQWYELVDFYHVVEHLGKIAALQKGWSTSQRKRWCNKHRRLLLKGQVEQVIAAIRRLCPKKCPKELRRELNYFIRNRRRMAYTTISQMGLPIGSGAMESAIRRVINLRLKGASIYWLEETAEAMIRLRSFFKAGRWNLLEKLVFSVPLTNFV